MKNIEFVKKFDCIVCLDGQLPKYDSFDYLKDIPIFAADGAVFKLSKINIVANKVIGDLDTFHRNPENINYPKENLVYIEDQNSNDFEKTLNYVIQHGFKNCLVLGMNGGESEHTLNNWSVFIRYSKIINLCDMSENRYGFMLDSDVQFYAEKDELISLIPQPQAVISTENLNWNLDNEILELGKREGARNFVTSKIITIYVHNGELLIFINQRLPFSPNFLKL